MGHFKETAEVLMESFGLSKSTLSDAFIAHSGQILEEFLERRLDDRRYVAMFIDGKVLNHECVVVAVGVDEHGDKRILGLTQATTENAAVIGGLLRIMLARGLDISQGILAVIDGSAGIRSALIIESTFSTAASMTSHIKRWHLPAYVAATAAD